MVTHKHSSNMSNGFLDSPSFRKITPPSQRERVERRRSSSGFTGRGTAEDPIRRETAEDIQKRERAQNLQTVQRQLAEQDIRLTESETQAILRGETPQNIISRVNQRLEQETTRTTPAQRFVDTGRQRIAVSDAFASKVDESIGRGDFERIAREERIAGLAPSTPEFETSGFRQTRAGRFVSTLGEPFVDPARTGASLRTGDRGSLEQAGRAIGFTLAAATSAIGGVARGGSSIPILDTLRFRTGQATGFLTRPVSRLAPSLGLTTERSRRIAGITITTAGSVAVGAEPVITARKRIVAGESTLGGEVSRVAPSLIVQAGAARALFGTGFRGGFRSGQDAFDTAIPPIPSRQVTPISVEATKTFLTPTSKPVSFTRLAGRRETTTVRSGFIPSKAFFDEAGTLVRTETLFPTSPINTFLAIPTTTATGALDLQSTFTLRSGLGVPRVQITPEASTAIVGSGTRPPPTDVSLSQYLSARPRPQRTERSLQDFFLELRSPTTTRGGAQATSTISISQLLPKQKVISISDSGKVTQRIVGGDLGEGIPGFSLSRAPRARSFSDDILPSTSNALTKLVANKKGQLALTRTIPKSPLSEMGKISSLNQPSRTRLGREPTTRTTSRTRITPLFGVIPQIQFATASASAFRASTDLGTSLETGLRSATRSITGIRTTQATGTTTTSITRSITGTPTSPTGLIPPSGTPRTPTSPTKPPRTPTTFDLSSEELFGRRKTKDKKSKRGFDFTPSISGATFQIKQTGSKATTGFTGLELRGI